MSAAKHFGWSGSCAPACTDHHFSVGPASGPGSFGALSEPQCLQAHGARRQTPLPKERLHRGECGCSEYTVERS